MCCNRRLARKSCAITGMLTCDMMKTTHSTYLLISNVCVMGINDTINTSFTAGDLGSLVLCIIRNRWWYYVPVTKPSEPQKCEERPL